MRKPSSIKTITSTTIVKHYKFDNGFGAILTSQPYRTEMLWEFEIYKVKDDIWFSYFGHDYAYGYLTTKEAEEQLANLEIWMRD